MTRVLLLVPTSTYRAKAFLEAAAHLGIEVTVGSEHRETLARIMGDAALVVPLDDVPVALERIEALHARTPIDAVVAVDDQGLAVAAAVAARLGFPANPPEAVAASRDKALMRTRLSAAGVSQPTYAVLGPGRDVLEATATTGYPCVVKPVNRAGSQGVIRADDPEGAHRAAERTRAIVGASEPLLVESFVEGTEVAAEALLEDGELHVLAVFDKPDPLDGPFFEETIYVTPSRQAPVVLDAITTTLDGACSALGLREGPVHAELRITPRGEPVVIEVAARSIGGLCARTLRFGVGISLEEVILRHAAGVGLGGLHRESQASGVMMLPIRAQGVLVEVVGREAARSVEGVVGLEITIPVGGQVVPLPEGDRYLGFLFARGKRPEDVEAALREAEGKLSVVVDPGARTS